MINQGATHRRIILIKGIRLMNKFLFYQLKPKDMESRFRAEMLAQDKTQTRTICYLGLVIFIGLGFLEYLHLGINSISYISIAGRCITIIVLLFAIWISYCQITARFFDRITTLMGLAVFAQMLIAAAIRPDNYFLTLITILWYFIAVFATYTVVPIPPYFQMILALFLTGGSFVVWLAIKAPLWSPLESTMLFSSYLFVNIYGLFMSIRMNRSRRDQFVLLENERKAKLELAAALSEIKVLRGIIPICASCKKIRDGEGYWNQVETYIENHSEARFSHGMCEVCNDEMYGDQEWYKKMKKKRGQND